MANFVSKVIMTGYRPRSPDLTPLDFYLWGYLKSKVYIDKPRTGAQLKTNIEREIAAIPRATLEKMIKNAEKRAHYYVVRAKGEPPEPNHIRKVTDMHLFTKTKINA